MIEIITGSIISLISLYIGYSLGKGSSIIPEETQKQVKRLIQALPIKRDIGAVLRPTQQDVERFNNPILQAEELEMSKTLSEIIK
jgi:hypothetical protein